MFVFRIDTKIEKRDLLFPDFENDRVLEKVKAIFEYNAKNSEYKTFRRPLAGSFKKA